MDTTTQPTLHATLVSSHRITPPRSPDDVRHLVFVTDDPGFEGVVGQCIRVRAPGRFGQRFHERLYSLAGVDQLDAQRTEFALLVRRCNGIDEFSGERFPGVASHHLCDLAAGASIEFTGPVGHPFPVPADRRAPLLMIGMGTGIAPFRGLLRRIYQQAGGWQGPVRLFYGARSGLEMLYMNDENNDLGLYYDQATFKAIRALSPRPHFGEPPALADALQAHAEEVWSLLNAPGAQLYIAGPQVLQPRVEAALAAAAGSARAWVTLHDALVAERRWHEVLY
jgi:ferredoxin--NADP+ reductase